MQQRSKCIKILQFYIFDFDKNNWLVFLIIFTIPFEVDAYVLVHQVLQIMLECNGIIIVLISNTFYLDPRTLKGYNQRNKINNR